MLNDPPEGDPPEGEDGQTLKLLCSIYRTGLNWKDQNLGRKVEVKYMNEPCNACLRSLQLFL